MFLSQFIGSSRWCMITSIARFLAALFELVAEACLGSNNCDVSVISCLCDMDAPIPCAYVSRLALAASNFSKQARSIGEIKVYQPSGEMCQQIDEKIHDQKALTKMYLLSLTERCHDQGMPSLLIRRVFDPRLLYLVTLLLLPKDVMQNEELTRGRLIKTQVNTHKNNQ
ncbi:hypothetical protein YC2023_041578 [Brassica napus]